jgi:electron transfer flavoprotein beta subunit
MKAKKKPILIDKPADLWVETNERLKTIKVTEPHTRAAGVKVQSVDEMIAKLKELGAL